MDMAVARNIAQYSHVGQHTRFGESLIAHVERVAAAVAPDARAVAYLHDVLEHSDTPVADLCSAGLTPVELAALQILTRAPGESFEAHTLRIAYAPGGEGEIARAIKLADLGDHLDHREMPHAAPPYGWARLHIAVGQWRLDSPRAGHAAAA
jgi:hypothetical protein